ncbi:hypothetical protein BDW62DRAFT_198795 [Aspergillus aurantiobrunneus]
MALRGKGPTLVGVLWMETFLCMVVLALRVYTRTMILRNPGWDDVLLLVTFTLMLAFSGLCTASAMHGMGVHASNLTTDEQSKGMLLLLSGQSVIAIAMGVSKCAVGVFLMRIVVNKWYLPSYFYAFLWFWNATIMALSVILAVSVFTQCTPVESIWDARVAKEACPLDLTQIATVMCAWSAVLDFVLALFPWYALWRLNIKQKEKVTICLSLSLGVFAGICGIIRTTSLGSLSESTDYLYATTDSVIWTNSELTTTIVCVSVPALRPLYRSLRGQSSSNHASNYNNLGGSGKAASRSRQASYGMDTFVTTGQGRGRGKNGGVGSGVEEVDGDADVDMDTRRILPVSSNGNGNGDGNGDGNGRRARGGSNNNIYQVQEVIVSYEERQGDGDARPVKARQHV